MADPKTREHKGRVLDAIVTMSTADELPSPDEVRDDLAAAGLVPGRVGRDLRERLTTTRTDGAYETTTTPTEGT